jgi:hypothetical protein
MVRFQRGGSRGIRVPYQIGFFGTSLGALGSKKWKMGEHCIKYKELSITIDLV